MLAACLTLPNQCWVGRKQDPFWGSCVSILYLHGKQLQLDTSSRAMGKVCENELHWKCDLHQQGCHIEPRSNSDLIQGMHLYVGCIDVLEISLCVIFQVIGDTEPGGEMRRMRQLIQSLCLMWESQWCVFYRAWWCWKWLTIVLSSFPLSSFLKWCQPLCGLCLLQRRPRWGSRPAGCSAESLHVAVVL